MSTAALQNLCVGHRFPPRGEICPSGTPGSVWRHFWFPQLGHGGTPVICWIESWGMAKCPLLHRSAPCDSEPAPLGAAKAEKTAPHHLLLHLFTRCLVAPAECCHVATTVRNSDAVFCVLLCARLHNVGRTYASSHNHMKHISLLSVLT